VFAHYSYSPTPPLALIWEKRYNGGDALDRSWPVPGLRVGVTGSRLEAC
jgi:hypothetical protein